MLDNAWWKDGNYTHKECIVCECRGQCMVNVMWMMRKQRTQRVKCKWNASKMQVKCKCLEQKCEHKWVWFTDIEWNCATCRQNLFKPSL